MTDEKKNGKNDPLAPAPEDPPWLRAFKAPFLSEGRAPGAEKYLPLQTRRRARRKAKRARRRSRR